MREKLKKMSGLNEGSSRGSRLVLVLGGARSGKSAYAEKRAEDMSRRKAFIATCPVIDEEMALRIERHKASRDGKGWTTIEEPHHLEGALERARGFPVVLVDCLTLWVNNLLYRAELKGESFAEDEMSRRIAPVLDSARGVKGTVIFVSNEVGMGLVPADALSRLYRDLIGRCNRIVAAEADEVVFLVAGIPNFLKKSES